MHGRAQWAARIFARAWQSVAGTADLGTVTGGDFKVRVSRLLAACNQEQQRAHEHGKLHPQRMWARCAHSVLVYTHGFLLLLFHYDASRHVKDANEGWNAPITCVRLIIMRM